MERRSASGEAASSAQRGESGAGADDRPFISKLIGDKGRRTEGIVILVTVAFFVLPIIWGILR